MPSRGKRLQPASLLTHRYSVEGADIAVSQTSRQPHVSLLPPLCPPAVLDPPVEAPVHVLGHPIAQHGDGVRVGHFALLEEDVAVSGHHLRAVHTVLRGTKCQNTIINLHRTCQNWFIGINGQSYQTITYFPLSSILSPFLHISSS